MKMRVFNFYTIQLDLEVRQLVEHSIYPSLLYMYNRMHTLYICLFVFDLRCISSVFYKERLYSLPKLTLTLLDFSERIIIH